MSSPAVACDWCAGTRWTTHVRPDGSAVWVPCLKCETDPDLRQQATQTRKESGRG